MKVVNITSVVKKINFKVWFLLVNMIGCVYGIYLNQIGIKDHAHFERYSICQAQYNLRKQIRIYN